MKTTLLRMFIAGVLAAFAWLSWSESRLAARVADAKQDIATFNHENLDALTPARAHLRLPAWRSPPPVR